jgi:hypothetical protein
MRASRVVAAGAIALLIQACSGAEGPPPGTSTSTTSTTAIGGGGTGGGDVCADTAEPPPAPADLCARLRGGPAGTRPAAIDLSAAYAGVRFFAPIAAMADTDAAISAALEGADAVAKPDLAAFAAALPGLSCALPAMSPALPEARVELRGDVAVIHPGSGPIALPEGTHAVAIDLRGLVEGPGLREAIEAAIAPALSTPLQGTNRMVRRHKGMEDEVFSATNVYKADTHSRAEPEIQGTASEALPLAVLTETTMAPSAALIAGWLRLQNRAWLFGEGVRADVAEARWQGVGDAGLGYRAGDLFIAASGALPGRWPDEIPADARSLHPECLLGDLSTRGDPPTVSAPTPARAVVKAVHGFDETHAYDITLGSARAALIAAHGAARLFFPYFGTVGDHLDDRLIETLDALGTATPQDRTVVIHALQRLSNVLDDGHSFVYSGVGAAPAGYFPVTIEDINGEPVVRRSLALGVSPGDTITSIGGVPASTWYATELPRTAAATDGYRFYVATTRYLRLSGPIAFGLRHVDGSEETIDFQPQPKSDLDALGTAPSARPAGFLGDLGAPELYYINADGKALSSLSAFNAALTEAASSKGLVLDMRGYPGVPQSQMAQRLLQQAVKSPTYLVTTLDGPDASSVANTAYTLPSVANPNYAGPVVLLVGHATVSAAEDFSLMLVDANRVKVMGRRSAGTNGNIAGLQTPAWFTFSFTGMEVRHADVLMSTFHGIGIVPDQESTLTAAAFAAGDDPELQDAIDWLLATTP